MPYFCSKTVMMIFLNIFLLSLAVLWTLPSLILLLECLSAVFLKKTGVSPLEASPQTSFQILIPAHNEAAGIKTTLESLIPQVEHPQQILVVADNCDDDTAQIARQYRVQVLERQEPNLRGKGFALDFGINALRAKPPAVVVFMDADCVVELGSIAALVNTAYCQQRPIQGLNLLAKPANASPKDTISALAFLVKNHVRPAGLAAWNLPCLLLGTGMAVPWNILCQATLAKDNLVEDIQLGLDLAIAGHTTQFCEQAKVSGVLPQQRQAATSQRTRWEHGYLQTLLGQFPRLIREVIMASSCEQRRALLALAAEISVVPLSLWVLLWIGGMAINLVSWWLGAWGLPTIILAIAGLLFTTAVLSAWAKFGQDSIPLRALVSVPFYILWKVPLYWAFLFNRQSQWVRTQRDN